MYRPRPNASPNYAFNNYYGAPTGGGCYYNTTTPGYTVEYTLVVVETLLYRLPDSMLVWSGTSQSFNPMSKGALVERISLLIGDEMRRKRLLGTGK